MIKIYEIISSIIEVIMIVHILVWKTLKSAVIDSSRTTETSIPTVINTRMKEVII